jgi:hypothetical protein
MLALIISLHFQFISYPSYATQATAQFTSTELRCFSIERLDICMEGGLILELYFIGRAMDHL